MDSNLLTYFVFGLEFCASSSGKFVCWPANKTFHLENLDQCLVLLYGYSTAFMKLKLGIKSIIGSSHLSDTLNDS